VLLAIEVLSDAANMRPMSDQWPMFILQCIVVVGLVGTLFIRGDGGSLLKACLGGGFLLTGTVSFS
jgi:hypothetical protein